MTNIFSTFRDVVRDAVTRLAPEAPASLVAAIGVEPPRDAAHGDIATNAAMVLAKALKQNPRTFGEKLAAELAGHPDIVRAEVAGPGFVNIALRPAYLRARLADILHAGTDYGSSTVGANERVNVEYVSANPTGPMHVGHCRGAVVGDALAGLLAKAGFAVTREYYVNDAGAQVDALAWAAYWRYLQAIGTTVTEEQFDALVPGGLQYKGEYLIPVGEALAVRHGLSLAKDGSRPELPSDWFGKVRKETIVAMMDGIRADLAALGVRHDEFVYETIVVEQFVEKAIEMLQQRGLIYEGTLEPPKGQKLDDWEPREQTLFRATAFGDDVDRPLKKSDGSYTYFANDIGNHFSKLNRGFRRIVQVWGADHGGYVKRMAAAVKALDEGASFQVLLCQIVHLLKGGEPMRMSKRAGTFVTLRDLIDEVGRDVVRFIMLTRRSDAQMEFDLDRVREQSKDNPVFYVQYAHARCRSVLRHAGENFDVHPASLAKADLDVLDDEAEIALIRTLIAWPRIVEQAALACEPHRLAFHLYDVAAAFHALWNRGRDETELRFIQADAPDATRARLALVQATATVIASGLLTIGVTPAEEMR